MIKMLAMAALAALVTACAAPSPGADPMRASRGSTPSGAAKAADLGFHGPLHRGDPVDGPN